MNVLGNFYHYHIYEETNSCEDFAAFSKIISWEKQTSFKPLIFHILNILMSLPKNIFSNQKFS